MTTSKSAVYRDFSRLIGEKCVAPEAKRPYLELLMEAHGRYYRKVIIFRQTLIDEMVQQILEASEEETDGGGDE